MLFRSRDLGEMLAESPLPKLRRSKLCGRAVSCQAGVYPNLTSGSPGGGWRKSADPGSSLFHFVFPFCSLTFPQRTATFIVIPSLPAQAGRARNLLSQNLKSRFLAPKSGARNDNPRSLLANCFISTTPQRLRWKYSTAAARAALCYRSVRSALLRPADGISASA